MASDFSEVVGDKSASNVTATDLTALLDAGESEAIQIAGELDADSPFAPDSGFTAEFFVNNQQIVGTIGVLALAGQSNLLDSENTLEKLEKTNFHVSAQLKQFLRKSK